MYDILENNVLSKQHDDAMVSAVVAQQEGPGF